MTYTSAQKLNAMSCKEWEKLMIHSGRPRPDNGGATIVGSQDDLMNMIPSSTYFNNSTGTDSSLEQRAFLLDETGKILSEVEGEYIARFLDGTESYKQGCTVRTSLEKLGIDAEKGTYVLLEEIKEETDNITILRKQRERNRNGNPISKEKTILHRSLMLYEIDK